MAEHVDSEILDMVEWTEALHLRGWHLVQPRYPVPDGAIDDLRTDSYPGQFATVVKKLIVNRRGEWGVSYWFSDERAAFACKMKYG